MIFENISGETYFVQLDDIGVTDLFEYIDFSRNTLDVGFVFYFVFL